MTDPQAELELFETKARHIKDVAYEAETFALPCGFPEFEKPQLIIKNEPGLTAIAARPGHGKTAIGLQLAANASKHGNTLFYSLEMSAAQIKRRMDSLLSGCPIKKLGSLGEAKKQQLEADLNDYNLYIDDDDALSITSLLSRTMDFHKRKPLSLIVIDYLQIIRTETNRSKAEEIAEISSQLRLLTNKIKVPILELVQMNRQVEGRSAQRAKRDSRPMMSDLGDSGAIERDCSTILSMNRPYLNTREREGEVDFFVLKHRHGDARDFTLNFSGELTKFFSREGSEI